jgi:N utilization substance protein B
MDAHSQRSLARRLALEVLYEWDSVGHDVREALDRRAEDDEIETDSDAFEFAERLVHGVITDIARLDGLIQSKAKSWPLKQLAVVDRNILRLAVSEISDHETPAGAVINEAVELAKSFGGEASGSFVNGVLGGVLAELKAEH